MGIDTLPFYLYGFCDTNGKKIFDPYLIIEILNLDNIFFSELRNFYYNGEVYYGIIIEPGTLASQNQKKYIEDIVKFLSTKYPDFKPEIGYYVGIGYSSDVEINSIYGYYDFDYKNEEAYIEDMDKLGICYDSDSDDTNSD